jgi:two-component sensor histidine kinase
MLRFVHIILIITCGAISLYAQPINWANDSLAIYDKKIQTALEQKNYKEVKLLFNVIFDEGYKSLDPVFHNYFINATKSSKYKDLPDILGMIYNFIGSFEYSKSNMAGAKSAFLQALEKYQLAGSKKSAAGMGMNLGVLMQQFTKYDSAILMYNKALPVFQEFNDLFSLSMIFENIGISYYYKGAYKRSLIYYEKTDSVLKIDTPEKDGRWADLWCSKGNVYCALANYDQSLTYLLKALRLSEELHDERRTNVAYMSLIEVYSRIDDEENFLKYIKLARQFAHSSANGLYVAEINYKMGNYYVSINLDSASHYAKLVYDYHLENNYREGLSKVYLLRGEINFEKRNYKQSIEEYLAALESFSTTENSVINNVYHKLGVSYMHLGNYEKSTDYLRRALDLNLEMGDKKNIKSMYHALSENSKAQMDFKNAYAYYALYKQFDDSIFTETKIKQLAEVQAQYETEKKDKAIAGLEQTNLLQQLASERQAMQIYFGLGGLILLFAVAFVYYNQARLKQKANISLEAKNIEIARQDKEKEILLKEIHHRVKNNLQIISSLLSMQTRSLVDNKVIDAIKESQSRVKTMALIHEKLYQFDNLTRIDMKDYLEQLSGFLSQTYKTNKEIKIDIDAENISLDIDTAIPLGLITNELLSNALKYAFKDMEEGEIKITIEQNDALGYQLIVSDTGSGIDKNLDVEKTTSMGLRLVRTLTRQINGKLLIQSGAGTTFSITFDEEKVLAA